MSDLYNFWRAALDGALSPVVETQPQAGFYRLKRNGAWQPVALWHEGQQMVCLVGGDGRSKVADAQETWLHCAKHAVTEDAYRTVVATGCWPGDESVNDRAVIGANQPPPEDADQALANEVTEQTGRALAWSKGRQIISAADADRCEKLVGDLRRIKGQVEDRHEVLKRPSLEEGRRIDGQWKPLVATCKAAIDAVTGILTPYLNARRREKEEALQQARAAGVPIARIDTRGTTSGVHGKKLALTTKTTAVITDWRAAVLFFVENEEIREIVQKRSNKMAADGAALPWFEIKREQVAR